MRGRKPKPTQQKILEGNPGHRPLNLHEPQHDFVDETFDEPPAELEKFATASRIWRELAPQLRRAKHVTRIDRFALVNYCLEQGRYFDALDRASAFVITVNDYPMPNPYLSVARHAGLAAHKWAGELGLTPSSRTRVTRADAPRPDDPFSEFDQPPPPLGDLFTTTH